MIEKSLVVLCLLAMTLASLPMAEGCDVPVHRYILVRWEREDYRAYYFYKTDEEKADREVNEFLADASGGFGRRVNLAFRALDVDKLTNNAAAEEDRKVWKEHASQKLPFHLVLTPRGTPLFRGRLDLPAARAMIQSPVRTEIARQLCEGKGGVLLLLAGDDQKESQNVQKDVRWVLERAKEEQKLDVGFLRLAVKAPREEWLIRSLLAAADLRPESKQPVLFGICGRARVLTFLAGREITRRGIIECVRTMNGDCSCELKEANPGVDLLTDWDWEGAIAGLPPVTEEPLRSVLLGFDDSEENSQGASRRESDGKARRPTRSFFRALGVRGWCLAFGVASVVMAAIGFIIVRRRKEG